jgi:hypothetical protein
MSILIWKDGRQLGPFTENERNRLVKHRVDGPGGEFWTQLASS